MTLLGVYNGNNPQAVLDFERWLGRPVDFHSQFTGELSWADFDGGVGWALGLYPDLPRAITWSIPLIPAGATLAEAAKGSYNAHYTLAAQKIAAGRQDRVIYVRTGWEFNGDWMKWASKNREREFIEAFRQFSSCFRNSSNRFRVVWCPNIGQLDPAPSYPGNEHVDVIGLDFYHQPRWDPAGVDEAWSYMVRRPFGLQWHLEFAKTCQKPMCFPEWGVSSDNFGSYVKKVAEWFASGDVLYQSYWDSNADYPGRLSGGALPNTGAAFRASFGSL
jgi:hypothetical protein